MDFLNFFPKIKALKCKQNQEYDVRAECPKTCYDPTGKNDCGVKEVSEGCFCKNGFLEGENDTCIPLEQCGCTNPESKDRIQVK